MEVEKPKDGYEGSTYKGKLLAKWLTKYIRKKAKELNVFQRDRNTLTVEFSKVRANCNIYEFSINYMPLYGYYSEKISWFILEHRYDDKYHQHFYPSGYRNPMLLGRYNRKLELIFGYGYLCIPLEERREKIWK